MNTMQSQFAVKGRAIRRALFGRKTETTQFVPSADLLATIGEPDDFTELDAIEVPSGLMFDIPESTVWANRNTVVPGPSNV